MSRITKTSPQPRSNMSLPKTTAEELGALAFALDKSQVSLIQAALASFIKSLPKEQRDAFSAAKSARARCAA